MATGSPFLARMHLPSHWLSWGQTRPQTAGRLFCFQIWRMDCVKSLSRMNLMKPGMSTPTGQPSTQPGFLHCRQREASSFAISGV